MCNDVEADCGLGRRAGSDAWRCNRAIRQKDELVGSALVAVVWVETRSARLKHGLELFLLAV